MNIALYAKGLGIDLYTEYKAEEAAKLIRIGINGINRAAKQKELPFIKTGVRNRVYLGVDLVKWKLSKRIESENSISQETGRENGVEPGTMSLVSNESSQAYALNHLKELKSS